jgi:hypothetical protein
MRKIHYTLPFLAVMAALVAITGLSGCERQDHGNAVPAISKNPVARDVFEKKVLGMNDQQVEDRVGKPDAINNYAGSWGILWVYSKRTINPVTGKPDQFTTLVFKDGVVKELSFK